MLLILTSAALVAEIREPPDISETNGVSDTREHKLHLVGPVLPSRKVEVLAQRVVIAAAATAR